MSSINELEKRAAASLEEESGPQLREIASVLMRYWKSLLVLAVVGTAMGLYNAYVAPPVYYSNALIHVESKKSGGLSDADSFMVALMSQSLSPAELEIVRSRAIISGAVEQLGLDIMARPLYYGRIGAAYARRHDRPGTLTEAPFIGFGEYAWGGERIQVNRFDVPKELEDTSFLIEAGDNREYRLLTADRRPLAQGLIEKAIIVKLPQGNVELYISELLARPGTLFTLSKRPSLSVITQLQQNLRVEEKGMRSGIIELSLSGSDPIRIRNQLNAIANTYLRGNVEKQSEEAEQVLAFLSEQLPILKQNVDATEAKLRNYQSSKGTIDLSMEASSLLGKLTTLQQSHSELRLQLAELKQKYTDNHPLVQSVGRKLSQVSGQLAVTEKELKKLPETESEFLQRKRDVVVANELYLQLLNRYQELKVVKAGITGFVRIIDPAYLPRHPIGPNRLRLFMMPLVLALLFGVVLSIARHAFRHTIENPDLIEKKLGLPTYASIPHSPKQSALERLRQKREDRARLKGAQVLARLLPQDIAVESLRSLRTSLQFALLESSNNIVTITGPTPGLGKSFVAENLAYLLTDAEKNTLLIDADMRLGHLNRNLCANRKPGLSDFISGRNEYEEVIQRIPPNGMHFIPCGTHPPNPAELLVNDRFAELLDRASSDFDIVIIDTPPILSLTDGILAAQASGSCLLVARAGVSAMQEIQIAAKRLRQNDVALKGVIFNDMNVSAFGYGYGSYFRYGKKYHKARPAS